MVYTDNQALLSWLEDMITLTCPDRVVWITGTPQQIVDLCGGFVMIPFEPIPETSKYICTREESSGVQWAAPPLMYARLLTSLSGSMKSKPMYVVPFASKTDDSKKGVLITDSPITIAAISMKCRIGTDILDEIGCFGDFIRGIHTSAEGEVCVASFPEDATFMASKCGDNYAGSFAAYISEL
ncbi:MAG: hypothetical protein HUJ65_03180 [Oscillospiraceae bacterium]|nr:hypothetical protein [Oscillospiraceae bacterium]